MSSLQDFGLHQFADRRCFDNPTVTSNVLYGLTQALEGNIVGVKGIASAPTSGATINGAAYGVYGKANGAINGRNYGVFGF